LASASGFDATQLGEGSTVGNHAVNLATGSKMNNAALIALDGASTSANAEHVIMTDGSGNLSWSQGVKSGAQSNDDYSIAIGTTTQTIAASPYSNTLVLNASNVGPGIQRYHSDATYINPIRQAGASERAYLKHIFWHPSTKELVYYEDVTAPTIELTGVGAAGQTAMRVAVGSTYVEQGARLIDGGVDIGPATVTGTVNTSVSARYTLTYTGEDANGNVATSVTRTVTVSPVPAHAFNFNDSGNSFSNGTLTFADGRTATAGTGCSWNATDGFTTPPNASLKLPNVAIAGIGDLPPTYGSGEFTIEMYFRFNSHANYHGLLHFYDGTVTQGTGTNTMSMERHETNNRLMFIKMNTNNPSQGPFDMFIGQEDSVFAAGTGSFVHAVVTHANHGGSVTASNNIRMYINGVEDTNPLTTGYTDTMNVPGNYTRSEHHIGRSRSGDTGNETIKFLRIYNSVLTPGDVSTIYANRNA
jgi:hypothetical protein